MMLELKFLKPELVGPNGTKPHMKFTLDLLADGALRTITYDGHESLKGLYASINKEMGFEPELKDWRTQTGKKEGHRKVSVVLALNGNQSSGEAEAISDVEAGVRAYLDALGRIPYHQPPLF